MFALTSHLDTYFLSRKKVVKLPIGHLNNLIGKESLKPPVPIPLALTYENIK